MYVVVNAALALGIEYFQSLSARRQFPDCVQGIARHCFSILDLTSGRRTPPKIFAFWRVAILLPRSRVNEFSYWKFTWKLFAGLTLGCSLKKFSHYLTNSIFSVFASVLSVTLEHCRSDSWMEAEGYASIFWLRENPS